ncbi:hybrid sensor histidine kinase/response regulator [Ramlibacter albus]|uniref:histidine kinase n=1 Tax=Ramlibacter albus TaxID=2079448 RepID=A0A923MD95_9BURK|nr:hybrid sensor histidine kinase/response regulator [Ramlibacter albus]MBC5768570.1 hybrid sensor histidine kinase/response regulator [Ramlibacter albus]
MRNLLPRSLAGRFGLASAAMAAAAVLIVSLGSSWLIERQQAAAERRFAVREREFHAENVSSTLHALAARMAEVAGSTILATGLVDSAGKETYLAPFLGGIRQVNGLPVQLLFTDFEGKEIAANGNARFVPGEVQWLRNQLATGRSAAAVVQSPGGAVLLALEPLRYSRTTTPEGAVFYKVRLADLALDPGLHLAWGPGGNGADDTPVDVPEIFKPLAIRVTGNSLAAPPGSAPHVEYLGAAVLALVAFAVLFLLGRRLAERLTSDLSALESFSSKVATAQAGAGSAPAGRSSEVASLASSINMMLERLAQQNEALQAEGRKLADLAEALRTADRRKDEFLAMLAHELRNPMAPISTGAELLRLAGSSDPKVQRTAEVIGRQVGHMKKIVDDLLDVSRVTRGLVQLDLAPMDLSVAVRAAADQLQPVAEKRHVALTVDAPAGGAYVMGDLERLVQVVANLLHNATKFTPAGGAIRVSVRVEEGNAVVEVADTGAGIPAEFMPELFGLFTQSERMADRSQGGLGLGLALVRKLVELHGGSVGAHSDGVGHGATFTVRLPLAQAPAAAEPAVPAPPREAPPGACILLVDDNADAADTLAALLRATGHDVAVRYSPQAAIEAAQQVRFDACVLDIGLPGMDGTQLARQLRTLPGASAARFIALTGYGQSDDRAKTADAGFHHHLVKPVDPDELVAALASARQ